jgi:hypothetical protein
LSKSNIKHATFKLTPEEALILRIISPGQTLRGGLDVAIAWARHFYQLGLRHDDPLEPVGLAVQAPGQDPQRWDDYHNGQD